MTGAINYYMLYTTYKLYTNNLFSLWDTTLIQLLYAHKNEGIM